MKTPGIESVDVKLVWYPVWSTDRMSDAAKKALGVGKVKSEKSYSDEKLLDFHTSIKTFAQEYPDFAQDMYDIGFTRIKIPGMLNTVGRVMNLELGSKAMGFDIEDVKKKLEEKGYKFDEGR